MSVLTSLNFLGRTEEALSLYCEALGAETIFLMRFRDSPDQTHMQPGMEDMIFHASFCIDGTEFMASDVGYPNEKSSAPFTGFSLVLRLKSVERGREVVAALGKDGQVVVPFAESAFTAWYGIVVDRFGVSWKITVADDDE